MSSQSQISATISEATKERLDRFTESHGLKKNFVVEQALLYLMEARRELPDEALAPARLVLENKAFDSGFSCGQRDLDRFFEHYAGRNQFKLHLAVNYVALVEGRIAGFATVAASSLERASVLSARLRKRLPAYPLPVLRLARLGVDRRTHGLGIGKGLLRHVLALAVEHRDRIGCVGVVTDAKPDVPVEGVREGLLHGEPLSMFLAIDTIASALGG